MTTVKGLKELFDAFEVKINQRFDNFDTLVTNFDTKLSDLDNTITTENASLKDANESNTEAIKQAVLQIKDTVITRLREENRKLSNRVRTVELFLRIHVCMLKIIYVPI